MKKFLSTVFVTGLIFVSSALPTFAMVNVPENLKPTSGQINLGILGDDDREVKLTPGSGTATGGGAGGSTWAWHLNSTELYSSYYHATLQPRASVSNDKYSNNSGFKTKGTTAAATCTSSTTGYNYANWDSK